jgi:nitrous oxidase accessory protein NosD
VCADNTVQLNYGNIYGILAAHSATITGNTVSSTVYGIGVQYDCTVTGNIVENTTTRGLVVTNDRNVLSSNWVECASWAIYFGPSANKNIVSNNVITQSNGAITESGGADHNMISDINAYDCNFGIITTGANTKVNQCWNMTTWIS